jgi:hypothetical protein
VEMSAATYGSLDPTNLGNLGNPLRLPGDEGLLGFLSVSDGPVSLVAQEEKVAVLTGKETRVLVYRAELDGLALLGKCAAQENHDHYHHRRCRQRNRRPI